MKLAEEINAIETELGQEAQGPQKISSITLKLKEVQSDSFTSMLKQWETASQMRQWTQKIKLTMSERLNAEIENKLRDEITQANPSKEPFTDQFNEEQKATIATRFNEQFDQQLNDKYNEVINKA